MAIGYQHVSLSCATGTTGIVHALRDTHHTQTVVLHYDQPITNDKIF